MKPFTYYNKEGKPARLPLRVRVSIFFYGVDYDFRRIAPYVNLILILLVAGALQISFGLRVSEVRNLNDGDLINRDGCYWLIIRKSKTGYRENPASSKVES